MDEMTLDEFKDVVKSLLNELECPICFNVLHSPVGQCLNGHLVCNDCHSKLNSCPTCKEVLQSRQIKMIDRMCDILPHKCKYSECQVIIKSGDDHEKWCGYQQTTCKCKVQVDKQLDKCNWTGSCRQLLEHIKSVHPTMGIWSQKEDSSLKKMSNVSGREFSVFFPIFGHEQFFWFNLKTKNQEEHMHIEFYMIPNGKVNHSFEIKVTLKNKNKRMTNAITLKAESWLCMGKEDKTFSWVCSKVEELVSSDGVLLFEFEVIKVND